MTASTTESPTWRLTICGTVNVAPPHSSFAPAPDYPGWAQVRALSHRGVTLCWVGCPAGRARPEPAGSAAAGRATTATGTDLPTPAIGERRCATSRPRSVNSRPVAPFAIQPPSRRWLEHASRSVRRLASGPVLPPLAGLQTEGTSHQDRTSVRTLENRLRTMFLALTTAVPPLEPTGPPPPSATTPTETPRRRQDRSPRTCVFSCSGASRRP